MQSGLKVDGGVKNMKMQNWNDVSKKNQASSMDYK